MMLDSRGYMVAPGYQLGTPILITCPTCGTNNPNRLPWTESAFMLYCCSNSSCADFNIRVLLEKASLTVMGTQ